MQRALDLLPRMSISAVCLCLLVRGGSAQELPPEPVEGIEPCSRVPFVFEGLVLEPDGSPSEGAVVLTSAGGSSVTDRSGSFRFEALVPLDASSVEVTALGRAGGDLAASANVALFTVSGSVRVDPLLLATSGCSPRWWPTFGPHPGMDGDVFVLREFDDGNGAALYAGGHST